MSCCRESSGASSPAYCQTGSESALPSSASSSFRQNHEGSHKEDFLEMIWFSFAHVYVVWVRACESVYFCQKKSLPVHLPLGLELILPSLAD